MKYINIYSILFTILIIIVIIWLIVLLVYYHIQYNVKNEYKIFRNVLSENETNDIVKCYSTNNSIDKICFKKYINDIINKIKNRIDSEYLHISYARFAYGNNYDSRGFHRDVKTHFLKHIFNEYPNVYTFIICFDDNILHQQGKDILTLNKGDVLMFNSFNIHRGYNIDIKEKENKPRRVLQFFNCFLSENEKNEYFKLHGYGSSVKLKFFDLNISDYYLKNFNGALRSFVEYFNLARITAQYDESSSKSYVSYVENSKVKKYINGIKFYSNLY